VTRTGSERLVPALIAWINPGVGVFPKALVPGKSDQDRVRRQLLIDCNFELADVRSSVVMQHQSLANEFCLETH
jgi:hypothetical protein